MAIALPIAQFRIAIGRVGSAANDGPATRSLKILRDLYGIVDFGVESE